MIDPSKILSCSQVQYLSFFGGAQLRLLPATAGGLHEFDAEKPIS